jgi:putative toxin-antitoxin system antitoxin component (TIGR02293 family)
VTPAGGDGLQPLRARGASADLLARLAASGLSDVEIADGVAAASLISRLRARLAPRSSLTKAETARLAAIAALADEVLELEGSAEAARRFWTAAMPWLGGKTPAETLATNDGPGVIQDLVNRLKYGIPP